MDEVGGGGGVFSPPCGVKCQCGVSPLPPLGADLGAAYGTAKSGVGIAAAGVMKPDAIMKSIIPVVMAGILGIYGLIIAVIIGTKS